MTRAWSVLAEVLRHDGLLIDDERCRASDVLRLLVNERLIVRVLELPAEHRLCLVWGDDEADAQAPCAGSVDAWTWLQHTDPQERTWTMGTHAESGARVLASSVPTHETDVVSCRAWLGEYLDWVVARSSSRPHAGMELPGQSGHSSVD